MEERPALTRKAPGSTPGSPANHVCDVEPWYNCPACRAESHYLPVPDSSWSK